MSGDFGVFVDGITGLKEAEDWSDKIRLAAVQAINKTAERTRAASIDQMRDEVNFPATYLNPSSGRFNVTQRATGSSLQATLRGRDRPTSLARFARTGRPNEAGVTVEVKPNHPVFLAKAFLLRLRNNNLGLAVRLGKGQTLRNSMGAKRLKGNLFLLYGPSVDQVFASVRENQRQDAEEWMGEEFKRLVELNL